MKLITYTIILIIFLTGCQNITLPKINKIFYKKTKLQKEKICKKNFTLMQIELYKEKNKYFVDLSSKEGSKKHIPLKVLDRANFKAKKQEKCFISPAAWLMITQPKRFEFYLNTHGDFKYRVKNKN